MYLLDTEVVLDLRDGRTESTATAGWAQRISRHAMFLSALSIVELDNAAALAGKQGKAAGAAWRSWIDDQLLPAFEGRIVPVDLAVARRRAGLTFNEDRDALLAATALEHGLALVTYRPAAFRTPRLKLVDPSRAAPDSDEATDWREATRERAPWLKNLFIRG